MRRRWGVVEEKERGFFLFSGFGTEGKREHEGDRGGEDVWFSGVKKRERERESLREGCRVERGEEKKEQG